MDSSVVLNEKAKPAQTDSPFSTSSPSSGQLRYCVVCGQGTHRPYDDFLKKRTVGVGAGAHEYVACDSHSDKEFSDSIAEAEATFPKEAAPVAKQEAAKAPSSAAPPTLPKPQGEPASQSPATSFGKGPSSAPAVPAPASQPASTSSVAKPSTVVTGQEEKPKT